MNSKSVLRLLLGTTAMSVVFAGSMAYGQTPAEEEEDAVIVTGIRGALQSAAETKRNSDTFVDSVTASDVDALPDNSVAEAIGRIPGVSVSRYSILPQYNQGGAGGASGDFPSAEGAGNLIRGLSFVRSEFNGRDQFTANGGRALDWASIPPELVGAVDVYKNSSAELIEGGIGGTINLRTLEPFDRDGALFSISGDATYTDLREEWSPGISVVASNRWETGIGEFGLMGSYSYSALRSDINDWQQGAPIAMVTPDVADTTQGPERFTGVPVSQVIGTMPVFQLRHNEQDRERESYYLAGQWQNDSTRVTAKWVRVENGVDTVEHTLEHLPDAGTPTNTILSGTRPTLGTTPDSLANLTPLGTRPFTGTVPLCNIGYSGAGGCSQPIAIGSIMTSGWITSAGADGGAYGYGLNTLGRGVVDRSMTQDFSITLEHDFSDQLHFSADLQYTEATAQQTELWAGGQTRFMSYFEPGLDSPHVQFEVDPRGNQITAVKPGLTPTQSTNDSADPQSYWWLFNADNHQRGTGELYAIRADIEYEFADNTWFEALKFGVRRSERSQINDTANQNWAGVAPPWSGGGGGGGSIPFSQLPYDDILEVDDYSDFFRGGVVQGTNTEFVYISRNYLLNYDRMVDLFATEPLLAGTPWQPRNPLFPPDNRSDITETTDNFYAQLDFGHEFGGGMSIQGNFGVRYARTELESTGNLVRIPFAAETACTPGTDANGVVTTPGACGRNSPQDFLPDTTAFLQQASSSVSYTNEDEHYLPSFNLKWNLNDDMLIRFGASQNLTRPNIQDMRAYTTYSASTVTTPFPANNCANQGLPVGCNDGFQDISLNQINVGGGNPRLRPTTSDNYDISFEWYFEGGYVSAAVFAKNIEDLVSGGSEQVGTVTLDGVTVPLNYGGPVNTRSVELQGVELAYQQFYDFLPGIFSHLGAQANFTYIDASADADNACVNNGEPCRFNITNLFGQSEYLANLVGIYQDDQFEARLAYSWRDEYLIVKGDYMTGNPTFNQPAGFLDASLRYNVNDHLQFRASVSNILDTRTEAKMQVDEDGTMLDRFSIANDRQFVFGFRYQY